MSTIQHQISTVPVYMTDQYKNFALVKGNRVLDLNKIKKILADIEAGTNLLKYCPILVVVKNDKLEIIDGQHRFQVAKKIKHPVHYIIAEDLSLYEIAKMNSNQEKWKISDFINCYKELGNEHYIKLEEILTKYPRLTATNAIAVLTTGKIVQQSYASTMDKFHRGQFVIEYEQAALSLLDKVNQFNYSGKFSRHFLMAIDKALTAGKYDFDKLVAQVNENISLLTTEDHWRKYLTSMEEIVSKGKQKRVTIY